MISLDIETHDILYLAPVNSSGELDTQNLLGYQVVSVDKRMGVITLKDKRKFHRSFLIKGNNRICLGGVEYQILLNDQLTGHLESLDQSYV